MKELINKGEYFQSLSEQEKDKGFIKFNIPNENNIYSSNGEGVWGWVTPEDKEKYSNDKFFGTIKAILCNFPLYNYGVLEWGVEVVLKCNGGERPTLDPEWIKEFLL